MGNLTPSEMMLRLGLAFGAGFVLGWERESHGRPAGLRTTILACVAAALAMILSEVLFVQSAMMVQSNSWRPDPARLAAGILTGIGFLGGGTILRHGSSIQGVTTAATLWFVTVLGLTFGSGEFMLGLVGTFIALVTLLVLSEAEKRMLVHVYSTLTVTADFSFMNESEFRHYLEKMGPRLKGIHLQYDIPNRKKTFVCDVQLTKSKQFELCTAVTADLSKQPGVLTVGWH